MSSEKQGGFAELPPAYGSPQGHPQGQPYPPNQGYPPTQGNQPPPPAGYYGQPQQGQQYGQPQQHGQPQQYTHTQQVVVTQPGQAGIIMTQSRPPDYMVPAVLVCLCCFWPTGLCAIYYASRANTFAREGDMVEAQHMSTNARNLMITSIVIGICWIVLVIVLRVVVYSTTTATYGY